MIVSEVEFFEVERETLWGNAVEFVKPLFGEAPETLKSVDVDPASREALGTVDVEMPIAAEHEAVIGLESVGVNDASPADGLDRDIGDLLDPNAATAFQDAEYGNFSRRTATDAHDATLRVPRSIWNDWSTSLSKEAPQ
jgi:hypothetical protein